MTPEQHILDALKTMEDRGVEPTWEDFEAIASLIQEEEQLTKEEINMTSHDYLMQQLSDRKLFGCTIDDITQIVAEIMDEKDKKLIQRFEYVLDHASGGNVSKYDTDLQTIIKQIDEHQSEHHYSIVKQDIQGLIDGEPDFGESVLSIQKYINNL